MKNFFKKQTFWLWLAIIVYVAIFCYLSFYKYIHYLYDGEDLAIFNNVFYNTSHGIFFWFSIHGGYNYLGDHLELGLLLLLPIYYFFQSPLTLLFLQTLLLGLSAWPLFLIIKYFLNKRGAANSSWLPLAISLAWLASPFLQNINLEEFHTAPLIVFFLLWTIYFNLQKKYRFFIFFFVLALLTREDSALPLAALAIINLWDNRQNFWQEKKWWPTPLIISGAWFLISLKIISFFSPENDFKYLLLYGGANIFNPLVWLVKFFAPTNLLIIFGYLVSSLFFPLFKPKYLLIALPTLLQISLLESGNSSVLYSTHYQAPILVGLFLAMAESLIFLKEKNNFKRYYSLAAVMIIFSSIYFNFYFGPLQFFSKDTKTIISNLENDKENKKILSLIPENASVAAPYRLLPMLSNRQTAYVGKMIFLGKRHLSTTDFSLPSDTDYLLLDTADILEYYLHFQNRKEYSAMYWGGAEKFLQTLQKNNLQKIYQTDSLILFKKDAPKNNLPFEITDQLPENIQKTQQTFGSATLMGHKLENDILSLWWQTNKSISDDFFFQIDFLNQKEGIILKKIYPPAWGILATHNWPVGKFIKIEQQLPKTSSTAVKISLENIKGDIELGNLNETELVLDKKTTLGEPLLINLP